MGSLEYAFARISARFGRRPGAAAWRAIEHAREFTLLLDLARNSAFRQWVAGVSEASEPHAIENLLRLRWREHLVEIAHWMPEAWCSAIGWCAVLADLPVVAHVARGGEAHRWIGDDLVYRDVVAGAPVGAAGPLAPCWDEPDRIESVWQAEWMRRAPRRGDPALRADLARTLAAHVAAFRDPALEDGWPERRALEVRLTLLFRRAVLDPASTFAYIGLYALDLERLRGELVRRAAFPRLRATT